MEGSVGEGDASSPSIEMSFEKCARVEGFDGLMPWGE